MCKSAKSSICAGRSPGFSARSSARRARRLPEPEGVQGTLGELFEIVPDDLSPNKKSTIAAHEREHKNQIEPIFDAQLDSVRLSRVIAMDETPIKAGRAGPGKMKAAYFWPVVGEQELTPCVWKQMFAANPLRSDLHDLSGRCTPFGG